MVVEFADEGILLGDEDERYDTGGFSNRNSKYGKTIFCSKASFMNVKKDGSTTRTYLAYSARFTFNLSCANVPAGVVHVSMKGGWIWFRKLSILASIWILKQKNHPDTNPANVLRVLFFTYPAFAEVISRNVLLWILGNVSMLQKWQRKTKAANGHMCWKAVYYC